MKTFAGCSKNSVCDSGGRETNGGFAQPVRIGMAFDEPGFELWGFGKTKDAVVVKVLLFGCAVLDRDGFLENRAQGE